MIRLGPDRQISCPSILVCSALAAIGSALLFPPTTCTAAEDPFSSLYKDYTPDFIGFFMNNQREGRGKVPTDRMKLSSEKDFYTLTLLPESSRAYALVKAGKDKEADGQYREALEIYQKIIDEYSQMLYRVSESGVFVPITQYCQLRILSFPENALKLYRVKYDARAREAFEQARDKNSLEGLALIRDTMLATSYGGPAIQVLGDAALDRGNFLEALEYFSTVQNAFPDKALHTPELALKIDYCRKMLGNATGTPAIATTGKSALAPASLKQFTSVVSAIRFEKKDSYAQQASAPHDSNDDYALLPPTEDPLSLKQPIWQHVLPGSRQEFFSFVQPVATDDSVIYRHKNILYSRSILTGELRWKSDLGGRVTWQNRDGRQYPHDDILVQDGLVFTPVYKVGSTLVALDQITGQMKWAYGPMVASTYDEAHMRFECAPAGGPRTIYAGYILDNIEGDTHTDTEYGVIAFESATGKVRWRRPVCRLRPEKFTAGFASVHRNRIRSFLSPPLYHEGTVYYCTNAGVITALDALSGQIKWVMRYPYYAYPDSVHDATRTFGGLEMYENNPLRHHRPMFWYNQRPFLLDENLHVLPVDSPYMFQVDRQSGKVRWSVGKAGDGSAYFMGRIQTGELLVAYSRWGGGAHLLDPATGKVAWQSGDAVAQFTHPALKYYFYFGSGNFMGSNANKWDYQLAARPFLSSDGQLYLTSFHYWAWPVHGWSSNMAIISLKDRKLVTRRHYFGGEKLTRAAYDIGQAPGLLKSLQDLPHKNDQVKNSIKAYSEIASDTVPINEHGPFLPFSRLTFNRYGAQFELRVDSRKIAMVYDREKLKTNVAQRTDTPGLFAQAELAMGDSRLADAATLMERCLSSLSSEDVDFRAAINQQLYEVHKQLARSAIRAADRKAELLNCMGMRQTVGTLAQEIETFFALAENYVRLNQHAIAARQLQSAISTYGYYEYPTPSIFSGDLKQLMSVSMGVFDKGDAFGATSLYGNSLSRSIRLTKKGLPLYFSALSPLKKDLIVRAGELAAAKLKELQDLSPTFAKAFEASATATLAKSTPEEQASRLWEFPATKAAQSVMNTLLTKAQEQILKADTTLADRAALRRHLWGLADTARICGLELPQDFKSRLLASRNKPTIASISPKLETLEQSIEEERGTAWLVLNRRDDQTVSPDLLFLGGRVKKKFDNKFVLHCMDSTSGKVVWKAQEQRGQTWFDEIRLEGKGDEPGFFDAFVYRDIVVVYGRSDVLAFNLKDGKLKWRFRVPFAFEIKHVEVSGGLMALAGQAETVVLYLGTDDERGEVAWQQKEEGDIYTPPFFLDDRLVSVRKLPFNITVRYRSTGTLIGRLALPDLSLHESHPLVDNGPRAVPFAHDGKNLVVTDGWYYIMVDVERMKVLWKRLIDENDVTREPPMRFALNGDFLSVIKQNYDIKTIYMLSSKTGEILWRTDPKDARSPQPIHSMIITDGILYGIRPHAGQGFYFTALDGKTGKPVYGLNEQKGYGGRPEPRLRRTVYGDTLIAEIRDRQDFELKLFNIKDGKLLHTMKVKAAGNFDEHGRASATVQNGRPILLGKNDLRISR